MKRLKSNKGFTLLELLCALSILLMVCLTTLMAMDVGIKNYVRNMTNSQAQILCSALTTKISDELRFAEVSTDTDKIIINPSFVGSQSTYDDGNGNKTARPQEISYTVSSGRLALDQTTKSKPTEVYLGQGVYSSGSYKLCVAELASEEDMDNPEEAKKKFWITYNPSTKIFTVNLVITAWRSSEPLIINQFQVKTLN